MQKRYSDLEPFEALEHNDLEACKGGIIIVCRTALSAVGTPENKIGMWPDASSSIFAGVPVAVRKTGLLAS